MNSLHPRAVKSNITRDYKGIIKLFTKLIFSFTKSPEKGAETVIYLASSPDVENISGKYFVDKKEVKSTDVTYDKSIAKSLWDICSNLTRLNN